MAEPDGATYVKAMDARTALLEQLDRDMLETARWTGRTALSPRVAAALAKVRREAFVLPPFAAAAYDNRPLPIEHGQTISQPFVVALMTELLDLQPEHTVLEVGTGSGYQAAVLAELAGEVVTVERFPALAEAARVRLVEAGYDRVDVRVGDGSLGVPERAPFSAIAVAAAAPAVPPALYAQLGEDGRLVVPRGSRRGQELVLVTRGQDGPRERSSIPVRFVPLVGDEGFGSD